jgi:hypothetical protein
MFDVVFVAYLDRSLSLCYMLVQGNSCIVVASVDHVSK